MRTCKDCGTPVSKINAVRCLACYQRKMAGQKKRLLLPSPYDAVDHHRWARMELYALFAERQLTIPYKRADG